MQYSQTLSTFYRPQMGYLKACALLELRYNVFSRVQVQYHYKNYYASLKAWICVCGGEGEGSSSLARPNSLGRRMQVEHSAHSGHTMSMGMRYGTQRPAQRPAATLHRPDMLLQRSSRFLVTGKQGIENALKPNISKLN